MTLTQLIQRLITITLALTAVGILTILMNQEQPKEPVCRDIRWEVVDCE